MLGRSEWVAAAVSALLAGVAVVVLAGLDDAEVVEVRVQGRAPALPELTRIGEASTTTTATAPAPTAETSAWLEATARCSSPPAPPPPSTSPPAADSSLPPVSTNGADTAPSPQ